MADSQNASLPAYDISGKEAVLGDLPHDQVHEAVASGRYSLPKGTTVPAFDQDGNLGDLPAEEAHQAFNGGYRYATPEAIDDYKNSSLGEQVKAGLEGVGEGIAGPLAPLAERAVGVNPEDITRRSHTLAHGVGQAAGLAGGILTGTGEAALMEGAGKLAVEAAGMAEPTTYAARVGSAAVKMAAENAVMGLGDEGSKLILQDPEQSATNAIANVGLSTALGAGMGGLFAGAVSPLWKATHADALASRLGDLIGSRGGIEGAESEALRLARETGVEIPDAVAAKINGNEFANRSDSILNQSDDHIAGRMYQAQKKSVYDGMQKSAGEALGVTPEYVSDLGQADRYSMGKSITDTTVDSLKPMVEDVEGKYESFNKKLDQSAFSNPNAQTTADALATKMMDDGWNRSISEKVQGFGPKIMKALENVESAKDLKLLITDIRQTNPFGSETYSHARDVNKILGDALTRAHVDGIIERGGTHEAAQADVASYKALRQQYSDMMGKFEDLDEHLNVGKWGGPKSFLTALSEKGEANGEQMYNKFMSSSKAQLLEQLGQVSPEALNAVKQGHIDNLIRSSKNKEGGLDLNKVLKNLDKDSKMSPQIKQLILSEEGAKRLQSLGELTNRLNDETYNYSKTARTISKTMNHGATPLALLAGLSGHGGIGMAAGLGMKGVEEGGAAVRLGLMNVLGSEKGISAPGFKASVKFIQQSLKGESMATKAVGALVKGGAEVLSQNNVPSQKERDKLDKVVENFQQSPNDFVADVQGQDLGHYHPGHQAALTQQATQTVQYLAQLKPMPTKDSPLAKAMPPSAMAQARYQRALDIAEQPLSVLQHVKDGTLQASDVQDLNAMYPGYLAHLSMKISAQIAQDHHDEEPIPYRTRMGLSLLLGQPMDSTMTPQNIMAAQSTMAPKQPPGAGPQGKKPGAKAATMMNDTANSYKTPGQSAESDRSSRS